MYSSAPVVPCLRSIRALYLWLLCTRYVTIVNYYYYYDYDYDYCFIIVIIIIIIIIITSDTGKGKLQLFYTI